MRSGLIEAGTSEEQIAQALERAIIDEGEASRLRAAEAARYDAIMVDEFQPGEFSRSVANGDIPDTTKGRISA